MLFDREYTCLTMTTVHASLIDYRFRTLPTKKLRKEFIVGDHDLDDVDQTFAQNGIIVEARHDLSPAEKERHREIAARQLAKAWVPQNVCEYFFYNDSGVL